MSKLHSGPSCVDCKMRMTLTHFGGCAFRQCMVGTQCATAAAFRYHLRVRVFLEHLKPVNRFGQPAYVYIGVWSAGFA